MSSRILRIDPLRHDAPIVDASGRPTSLFQRQWLQARGVDEAVEAASQDLSTISEQLAAHLSSPLSAAHPGTLPGSRVTDVLHVESDDSVTLPGVLSFPGGHSIERERGGGQTDFEFWHGGGFDVPNVKMAAGGNIVHAVQADANALQVWQTHLSTFPLAYFNMAAGSTGDFVQMTDGITMPFRIRHDGRMVASTQRADALASDSGIVSMAEFTVDAIPTTPTGSQWIAGRFEAWAKPTGAGAMAAAIAAAGDAILKPEATNNNIGAAVGSFGAVTNQNATVPIALGYGGYAVARAQGAGGFGTAVGHYARVQNAAGGTIELGFGYSAGADKTAGTITEFRGFVARDTLASGVAGLGIGFYAEDQQDYAAYTNAGEVRFGDTLRAVGPIIVEGGLQLPVGVGATFSGDVSIEGGFSVASALSLNAAIEWTGGFSTPFIDLPAGAVMVPNLDAEYLGGYDATAFPRLTASLNTFTGQQRVQRALASDAAWTTFRDGEGNARRRVDVSGKDYWGPGTAPADCTQERSGSGTLKYTGSRYWMASDLEIDGAFDHDGTTFGALGAAPATQAVAIASPSGGATVDTEARAAIDALRAVFTRFGFTA